MFGLNKERRNEHHETQEQRAHRGYGRRGRGGGGTGHCKGGRRRPEGGRFKHVREFNDERPNEYTMEVRPNQHESAPLKQKMAPTGDALGFCPLCDNQCPLDAPACPKGKAYAASAQAKGSTV